MHNEKLNTYKVTLFYTFDVEAENESQAYEYACGELTHAVDSGYCDNPKDLAYTVEKEDNNA